MSSNLVLGYNLTDSNVLEEGHIIDFSVAADDTNFNYDPSLGSNLHLSVAGDDKNRIFIDIARLKSIKIDSEKLKNRRQSFLGGRGNFGNLVKAEY